MSLHMELSSSSISPCSSFTGSFYHSFSLCLPPFFLPVLHLCLVFPSLFFPLNLLLLSDSSHIPAPQHSDQWQPCWLRHGCCHCFDLFTAVNVPISGCLNVFTCKTLILSQTVGQAHAAWVCRDIHTSADKKNVRKKIKKDANSTESCI